MPIISDLSKIEGRLMAHFEATMMLSTNNHFKTLLRAICGFTGPKTPKIRPKRALNQPEDPNLAIKWERKVLETPFWYQTKGLQEQSLNKLFWQQINIHKVSKSPKNTIFGSKTAISRPLINLKINTFNIKPTPKIFFGTVHYPY